MQRHWPVIVPCIIFLLPLFSFSGQVQAQGLQPGFNKAEYAELMKVSVRTTADTAYAAKMPPPQRFTMRYRSPVTGLDNLWDLWDDGEGTMVVSVRGTTKNHVSWLENFHAAMVPATGVLQLEKGKNFHYRLAANPKAAVHAGWLVGLASMAPTIVAKLDSTYRAGNTQLLIMGHSQGGAIAYLLSAYVKQLQQTGGLPSGLRIKTYCSAAPKPGNLQFAYAYEAAHSGGWAFNVVNAADWVPESPISIQTLHDFNNINPFSGARQTISKMKFPANLALRHVFNQLSNSTLKAEKKYRKYLGKMVGKQVRKNLPQLVLPPFVASSNYMRAGTHVVLPTDSAYFVQYPDTARNIFTHHLHAPYLFLLDRLPDQPATTGIPANIPNKAVPDFLAGIKASATGQRR